MIGSADRRDGGTYLEAIDGEEAAEDAFLEAGAEHYHVVLFIHGWRRTKERRNREPTEEREAAAKREGAAE